MLVRCWSTREGHGTPSDAELAAGVQGGDPGAEAELFRRLAPRVRLYGLRHLRDPAAADDLVQDVILLTFDALRAGTVRETERLASFVLGTCRRVVADLRRGGGAPERPAEAVRPGLAARGRPATRRPLDLDRAGRLPGAPRRARADRRGALLLRRARLRRDRAPSWA